MGLSAGLAKQHHLKFTSVNGALDSFPDPRPTSHCLQYHIANLGGSYTTATVLAQVAGNCGDLIVYMCPYHVSSCSSGVNGVWGFVDL